MFLLFCNKLLDKMFKGERKKMKKTRLPDSGLQHMENLFSFNSSSNEIIIMVTIYANLCSGYKMNALMILFFDRQTIWFGEVDANPYWKDVLAKLEVERVSVFDYFSSSKIIIIHRAELFYINRKWVNNEKHIQIHSVSINNPFCYSPMQLSQMEISSRWQIFFF